MFVLNKVIWRDYRTIHMRFRRKVADAVYVIFLENPFDSLSVSDIGALEHITLAIVPLNIRQTSGIAGVSESVHINNTSIEICFLENVSNEI